MATVLVTGGTGLIGKALSKALLGKGYHVIVLTRKLKNASKRESKPGGYRVSYALWDIKTGFIDEEAFSAADYIVHLAGAGIADKRWTKKRKLEIVNSRVQGSKLIVEGLATRQNKVQALITASAIGWYGQDPSIPNPRPFIEPDPPAGDFLGETCKQWEEASDQATQFGKRVVHIRTGIVVSKYGGAIREFMKPLRAGVAAILGNGKQLISWIHMDDLVSIYIAAIEKETIKGAFNAVTPQPVSNRDFILGLAKARDKFFIPVHIPAFILKLVLGEMSIEVLKSATVSSEKIQNTGFVFQFPELGGALQDVINK